MLRAIEPKDLIFEWDRVRTGLLAVQEHSAEDWLPEDVYMALKLGNAVLYVAEDAHGDYLGFVVLQLLPTFHGKKLHVWCAYGNNGKPLLRMYLDELKTLAKSNGANKVTFSSPRDEWLAVAKRGGFKAAQTLFELTI